MQREALCAELYEFLRTAQGACIAAYRDLRFSTRETHWGILVTLPGSFDAAIRAASPYVLLDGSEYGGTRHSSLVKCAVGRAAFDVDWNAAYDEAEYRHEPFSLSD